MARKILGHTLLPALVVVLTGLVSPAGAGKKEERPLDLPAVHENASATVRFRTPGDWTVVNKSGDPEVTEARGGQLMLRVLRRSSEWGLDGLHVDCMQVRLAGPMETRPDLDYEYDFVGGAVGGRQVLTSAFVVHYDAPVAGERDWWQRNLTVAGGGESLCVIGYGPASAMKKAKDARRLLDAVVASVEWQPWR